MRTPPSSPSSPSTTFFIDQGKKFGEDFATCWCTDTDVSPSDVIVQLLKQLEGCTRMAGELVDLVDFSPSEKLFPSSPISTSSISSQLSGFEALGLWDIPTIPAPDSISGGPTPDLAPGPHPFNPSDRINPNGPIGLYVPGELTLDGHAQCMYNGFVYDVPLPSENGQLYLVTVGRRVGITVGW